MKVHCFQYETVFIYKSFEICKIFAFFLLKKCQKEENFRVAQMGHPRAVHRDDCTVVSIIRVTTQY